MFSCKQAGEGLSGSVPALNKLKKVTFVHLSGNSLKGALPTLPPQLWELDVSDNSLSGAIPPSYGARLHKPKLSCWPSQKWPPLKCAA